MRTALTIAGSDSGGGAGIQADLKSFAAIGVHGTTVVTCVTAQNTRAVESIFPIPAIEVRRQLRAVLGDFEIGAAKTGMLYSAEIVRAVAKELAQTRFPLVVDPVMVATVGASLERDDFRDALVDRLLPRADLITPNRHEAERLSGIRVTGLDQAERAARAIRRLGPRAVLVKGGHLTGRLVDVLDDGRRVRHLSAFRHDKELHGSGCTLAASIAGHLARGRSLLDAIAAARSRVAVGFLESYRAGHGVEIINSHVIADRYDVWQAVDAFAPRLASLLTADLEPPEGADLAYALPGATSEQDVCALRERIQRHRGRFVVTGSPSFPATRDAAVPVLVAGRFHPGIRSSATLKYNVKNERPLRSTRLAVAPLERSRKPRTAHALERGIEQAIVEAGTIPDVVFDEGVADMRVLGRDPQDVVRKVRRIARSWNP